MADEQTVQLNDKLSKIAEQIEGLTVVELADLAKYLEEKFGVSGMPMMAAGAMPAAGAGGGDAAEPAEEKTEFTVELTEAGGNKLAVIKAVRELVPTLGLIDAKKLVESAPKPILENVKKEAADEAKAKLEGAGAKVALK